MKLPTSLENLLEPVSNFLGLNGKGIVAVDIGLNAVKVAEMDGKHHDSKFTLMKYASVALPEGAIIEDEIQKPEEIVDAIKEALNIAGITTINCCISISGPNSVARKLQLAGGNFEEIEDQVIWESEQYLPFDIEDSSVSFHIVGENEGGGVDVIVAAARNDVISNFKNLANQAGLKVKIVDLSTLALVNLFELVFAPKIQEPHNSYLILDIGAQKTTFIIYKNKMIFFAKEINIGGVIITEEIQRQMGVNYYEAEDLKITGDAQGNLPEEILEIVDSVVESFFSEIKKTLDFYISSTSDESLTGSLVTGGSCLIPGLLEGLEVLVGVPVSILNPFESIKYSEKKFSEEEINDIIYKGANVLGLAMRKP